MTSFIIIILLVGVIALVKSKSSALRKILQDEGLQQPTGENFPFPWSVPASNYEQQSSDTSEYQDVINDEDIPADDFVQPSICVLKPQEQGESEAAVSIIPIKVDDFDFDLRKAVIYSEILKPKYMEL
ncbi:MAG: hypothetical protein RSA50_05225 [Mucinivorans sp.]